MKKHKHIYHATNGETAVCECGRLLMKKRRNYLKRYSWRKHNGYFKQYLQGYQPILGSFKIDNTVKWIMRIIILIGIIYCHYIIL